MGTLYHCINRPSEGDAIRPTYRLKVNGADCDYVFAATHLSKALAFGFSYHDGEVLMNGGITQTSNEYILLCGGQATLEKKRSIHVFSFSDCGFRELNADRQMISSEPVPFSKTEAILTTDNINDLMENGLQIFLLPDDLEAYRRGWGQHGMAQYMDSSSTEGEALSLICNVFHARWINAERGIGVCSVLQARMQRNKAIPCGLAL